ncbi:SPOR domain-containing protein [Hyphomicrobium sp.]|uniref:SPOR domain-containing protein n=1 Tax=Hyphomicrobium sp. TaxID=82 RepID=UPI0025C4689F|nr:SPOR domain-containing protein [Hyphomicrobium sp.]MCC7251090.1 SPOR domain-containing protein [Hyphomicrobium sp.]
MAAFDRDASIERQQIHEISLNVARRLRQVLDRNHYIPAALRPEVDSTVRVITGIQRDIDQIMGALPADEALDFAILTHIMGGQRHALDLLEILEEKLEGGRGAYRRDSARVHEALLAVSREIEQDALRYAAEEPMPRIASHGPARQVSPGQRTPDSAAPAPQPRPSKQKGKPKGKSRTSTTPSFDLRGTLPALAARPVSVAVIALAVGAGLVVAAQKLIPDAGTPSLWSHDTAATLAPGGQLDSRRDAGAGGGGEPRSALAAGSAERIAVTPPSMEQPYLVVLATRRSTEELQQDYRAFKGAYPDLLGSAKARVDRVQGQDKQTWYRLSLIPPQARDDAKTLCSSLKKAGLTGCWIKPVPLR